MKLSQNKIVACCTIARFDLFWVGIIFVGLFVFVFLFFKKITETIQENTM